MKVVIDTNMVMAALIRDSKTREIIVSNKFEFVSPDFVLDETYKYKDYICEKAGLTKEEFELLMTLLFDRIKIIAENQYETQKEKAKQLMKDDIKDVPYTRIHLKTRDFSRVMKGMKSV